MNHPAPSPRVTLNHPIRFITATSLFDGHDASINIMRRILQSHGVEVIHLGHNRSVEEIVNAAIQEDVQGIAVSSYQGGHNEFFKYMVDLLKEKKAEHIQIFGGGGGVIIPEEIEDLMQYGVNRIYSPEDGRVMGLEGMIIDMIQKSDFSTLPEDFTPNPELLRIENPLTISQSITWIENHIHQPETLKAFTQTLPIHSNIPVVGITGTGGAGKSCLTDELIRRLLLEFPSLNVGILCVDPSKRKTGGALLGDRMRMNALDAQHVYMRSIATRQAHLSTSASLLPIIQLLKSSHFDIIFVETAGIGQSDSEIIDNVDLSIYVMTPEFGAATQLEKIDMIDFADFIVINKFDKPGAEDALLAVKKQYRRSHLSFSTDMENFPVFGTIASQFNEPGTNKFYHSLVQEIISRKQLDWNQTSRFKASSSSANKFIPAERKDYLRNIASEVRAYKKKIVELSQTSTECFQLYGTLEQLKCNLPALAHPIDLQTIPETFRPIAEVYNQKLASLPSDHLEQLQGFEEQRTQYRSEKSQYVVRGKEINVENHSNSLSGIPIPKIAVPTFKDWGEIVYWQGHENFPGEFPYTAGVFPFKRKGEMPTRMFAGEGIAERTNRRFHYLAQGGEASRLSTAFDSVTLYGANPAKRPDIYGKVGNAGVSICTIDDAKRLYSGFDLSSPSTSVSMTINGPAPVILAFFLNAAIDQEVEKYLNQEGQMDKAKQTIEELYRQKGLPSPTYRQEIPDGHNGLGLATLGVSGDQLIDQKTYQNIKQATLATVRGTVQADILKEDQAQNTCIFSTEFALRMMGDIQEYFTAHRVKNFYSVSISGYHIAEAGANPISQVAFTLANGFTIIEYYLSRGLSIDDFAHNLSFFFSNGMDPEYTVIGRVARRIFAIALRDFYGANARSQKLKYHIQTSGRSLHAQEMSFNDIRTTLQALYAIYDNCNSLHTNAYDEAVTTPTEESVRRALAIQLVINQELGLAKNENPLQGSFVIEELTNLVEEAILSEFIRLSDRGGVLGAMETMYQRNKIQEESLYYESLKHSGEYPVIGVNTFINPNEEEAVRTPELARSTEDEKQSQLQSLDEFHQFHQDSYASAMEKLRVACSENSNIFEVLMDIVKVCSLGQISEELYRQGGKYRRNV